VVIIDEVIAGLAVANDGPTGFGTPTTLTATITAGSNAVYAWAYGDGTVGSGDVATHTYPAVSPYTAVVTASNSVGFLTATTTVVITNHAPVLASIGDKWVTEDERLYFVVSASDPDGSTPALSASDVPTDASFIPETGAFNWTPGYDAAGTYTITFSASDGHLTDTESITVTVTNLNRWPVLEPIGDKWITETGTLAFTVIATDPDGITPTLSASGVPTGASFVTQTGVFSWTPGYGAAGTYGVTFAASDGDLADSESVTIRVTRECTPLQSVDISGPTIALSGTAIALSATYLPPDATGVTLMWDNGSTGSSATYTWSEGVYTVLLTATAACGDPVTATHAITVTSVCTPLQSVDISGPTAALSGTATALSATYLPLDATGVTLTWDNGSTGPSTTYTWPEGVYTVLLTATAVCGDPVTATHTITVTQTLTNKLYLPLVMRSHTSR
jgi:PKD repeat protein